VRHPEADRHARPRPGRHVVFQPVARREKADLPVKDRWGRLA
jgi:hypothetical protein